MARSAKGVRGLFVWHDLYWGGKHAAGEGAGAGTGAAGRGAPGMFLPGREPEDAGPGNRPRPAAAGPGAGGSGRLPAGRRREGSGLTEPGEPGARDPSGARARCGPLPPPPHSALSLSPSPSPPGPRRPRRRQAPLRERGGRQNPGRMGFADRGTWRRWLHAEAAPLRPPPPGWRSCRVATRARGGEKDRQEGKATSAVAGT